MAGRKNNTGTKGVSVVKGATATAPWQLSFNHPLTKKQIKRSIDTTDGLEAVRLARVLSSLIQTPSHWGNLPDTTPDILKSLWTVERGSIVGRPTVVSPDGSASLLAEVQTLRDTVLSQNAMIENLKAQLRAMGSENSADYLPKMLLQAVEDFLSNDKKLSGTGATGRVKVTLKSYLDRFVKEIGDKLVHEVSSKEIINHLADCLDKKDAKGNFVSHGKFGKMNEANVKKIGNVICQFLVHQTKGSFKPFTVKEWVKKHLDGEVEQINKLWLDEIEFNALTDEMAKDSEVWAAIASLSYWCGFRPEELVYLRQGEHCKKDEKGDIRLEVCKLLDVTKKKEYWRPKTIRSYGKVYVPSKGMKALDTLLTANKKHGNSFLIFPNIEEFSGVKCQPRDFDAFQIENHLWQAGTFTDSLLAKLRKAANALKWSEEKLSKLDSRTLRRSCGKRVLVESNLDINIAAAVLRDLPETVRKHYADSKASEVKQKD